MTGVPRPAEPVAKQLIAALVPVTVPPQPDPAPMPALAAPPEPEPEHVLIATCVIDRSGRIGAAPLLAALAWQPGDPVEVDAVGGVAVIRVARTGRVRIGSRGDIGIPSAVRALSGLARARTCCWPHCRLKASSSSIPPVPSPGCSAGCTATSWETSGDR